MDKTINQHEIVKQLKKYIYEVKKADRESFDILLSEIKAYIYSNENLAKKYIEYLENFEKTSQTNEYQEITHKFYSYFLILYKELVPTSEQTKLANELGEDFIKKFLMLYKNLYFPDILEKIFHLSEMKCEFSPAFREIKPDITMGLGQFYFRVAFKVLFAQIHKLKKLDFNDMCNILADMHSFFRKEGKNIDFYFMSLTDLVGIYTESNFSVDLFKIATVSSLIKLCDDMLDLTEMKEQLKKIPRAQMVNNEYKIDFESDPVLKQLTETERIVLNGILCNLDKNEISNLIVVEEDTVKKHIGHISQKLKQTGVLQKGGFKALKKFGRDYDIPLKGE